MKRQMKWRILLLCLTLLWMLFIFFMSSRRDDESRAQSSAVCAFLCEVFVEGYAQMPPARQIEMQSRLSFPVRKGAHLTEYMILGALLTLTAVSFMTAGDGLDGYGRKSPGSERPDRYREKSPGGERRDRDGENSPEGEGQDGEDGLDGKKDIRKDRWKIPNALTLEKAASRALPAGLLYAVSDEIHQCFVPGRAGQLRDVLIDTAGVLLGTCLVRAAGRFLRNRPEKREGTGASAWRRLS